MYISAEEFWKKELKARAEKHWQIIAITAYLTQFIKLFKFTHVMMKKIFKSILFGKECIPKFILSR